jgi:hypothetical protein
MQAALPMRVLENRKRFTLERMTWPCDRHPLGKVVTVGQCVVISFDNIDHHLLMNRVRGHCVDRKVNRLLVQFLKAGVLAEEQFVRTEAGTPQGGIATPRTQKVI